METRSLKSQPTCAGSGNSEQRDKLLDSNCNPSGTFPLSSGAPKKEQVGDDALPLKTETFSMRIADIVAHAEKDSQRWVRDRTYVFAKYLDKIDAQLSVFTQHLSHRWKVLKRRPVDKLRCKRAGPISRAAGLGNQLNSMTASLFCHIFHPRIRYYQKLRHSTKVSAKKRILMKMM